MDELKYVKLPDGYPLGCKLTHIMFRVVYDKYHKTMVCRIRPVEEVVEMYNGMEFKVYSQIYDYKPEHEGFDVTLQAMPRKNQRRLEKAWKALEPHLEEIKDLFLKGDYKAIMYNLKNITFDV